MLLPDSRRRYGGLILSVLAHGALLAVIVFHGERLWRRTLPPGAPAFVWIGDAGGGGGNRAAYITLPSVPKPPAPPKPPVEPPVPTPQAVEAPVPEPVTPLPDPRPVDTLQVAAAPQGPPANQSAGAGPGTGGGTGGREGEGIGPGRGDGAGPGPGGGGAGAVRPPELRDLAFPFDTPPKDLRGASLDVTFWVRVDGRVERYQVQPEIVDRDYAQKFDEVIRAFRFSPARAPDGSRVAGTTTVTFTLPGKRNS